MAANVRDIESIAEFRSALLTFSEEVRRVLDALQIELQRAFEWIEQDRPFYWDNQVRRAFDAVAQTRTALSTCQMRTVAGRRPSCIEEKVAYDKARRRLQHCQEQVQRVQQWATKLRHEADEFRGRMSTLNRVIQGPLPRAVALLERMVDSLQRYADLMSSDPLAETNPAQEQHASNEPPQGA